MSATNHSSIAKLRPSPHAGANLASGQAWNVHHALSAAGTNLRAGHWLPGFHSTNASASIVLGGHSSTGHQAAGVAEANLRASHFLAVHHCAGAGAQHLPGGHSAGDSQRSSAVGNTLDAGQTSRAIQVGSACVNNLRPLAVRRAPFEERHPVRVRARQVFATNNEERKASWT